VVSTATRISLIQKDLFQSPSHVSLLCVYRIDLAPAPNAVSSAFTSSTRAALLRVDLVLAQVWRCRYEETFSPPLSFQGPNSHPCRFPRVKRPVRIKQQGRSRATLITD